MMDMFREAFKRGLTLGEAYAMHDVIAKETLVEEIKKLGKCKVERSIFGFFSSHPNSWGNTSFEEGDVISSYDELITLAEAEGYSEKSIVNEYKLGFLKIVPVK